MSISWNMKLKCWQSIEIHCSIKCKFSINISLKSHSKIIILYTILNVWADMQIVYANLLLRPSRFTIFRPTNKMILLSAVNSSGWKIFTHFNNAERKQREIIFEICVDCPLFALHAYAFFVKKNNNQEFRIEFGTFSIWSAIFRVLVCTTVVCILVGWRNS